MTEPVVSVVIPFHEGSPEFLTRAIRSVQLQTYRPLEVYVVDDGSRLAFGGIEQDFGDLVVRWTQLHRNRGVAEARNTGIRASAGRYVAFLDADDWWEPKKMEEQIGAMISGDWKWCYCSVIAHTPFGLVEMRATHEGDISNDILRSQIVTGSCSSVVVDRQVLDTVGLFATDEVTEDWDLWIRLSKVYPIACVDKALVNVQAQISGGRSSQVERRLRRSERTLEKHESELRTRAVYQDAWARHYRTLGRQFLRTGAPLRALHLWLKIPRYSLRAIPWLWLVVAIGAVALPAVPGKVEALRTRQRIRRSKDSSTNSP